MDLETIESMIMKTKIGSIDLHSGELKVNNNKLIRFNCSTTARCCDQLDIFLSDLDIYRIESQGYDLEQFVEDLTPEVRIPTDSQEKPVKYYRIKKRPFDKQCVFLENKLCKIHDFKPHSCRIFPFSLKEMSESTLDVYVHPADLCKSVLPGDKENNDNEKWLKYLLKEEMREIDEKATYDKKIGD